MSRSEALFTIASAIVAMIFSRLVVCFGRAGRQDVDGNLTGHFFFIDSSGLPVDRGRSKKNFGRTTASWHVDREIFGRTSTIAPSIHLAVRSLSSTRV
ncbi:hypothetical protein BDW02DRAFT_68349 [Decorospora gaudefroyi]|uniref:Uncharacterized protein n=1 Tax=Decorospora gaudefroyi TaxID=184978 RepID=A0A6A5KWI4_9PLEO|nr:hypothetical protein BDW02DRAFT_68349 [Decorospora gaudefroyi]